VNWRSDVSDELLCRNTTYKHACDPRYARKYGGYCLDCANAGVPDKDAENARLRARVADLEVALRELLSDSAAWQLGLDSRQRAAALLEKPQ
jgi:hypothetical protein